MKEVIVKLKSGMEVGYGQEIVRCKDCKHYLGKGHMEWCNLGHGNHEPDWFCKDGINGKTNA